MDFVHPVKGTSLTITSMLGEPWAWEGLGRHQMTRTRNRW